MPDPKSFTELYLKRGRPVVIQNLFAGQPIRDIQTAAAARDSWGNEEFRIRSEYIHAYLSEIGIADAPIEEPRKMTLSDYLDFSEKNPDTRLLCTEEPATDRLLETFEWPQAVLESEDPPVAQVFFGNRGNHAHLHFDGDCRHGLLYQVYGRKSIFLVSAEQQARLMPFGLYSGWFIDRLSRKEREALTRFVEGEWVTLEPGETLFLPAFMSHYVEYVEDGMSISIDFGRNRAIKKLYDAFPHTRHLQLVGSRLLDLEKLEREHPGFQADLTALILCLPRDSSVRRESLRRQAIRLWGQDAEASVFEDIFRSNIEQRTISGTGGIRAEGDRDGPGNSQKPRSTEGG
ncbi:MAG: cupin-like domain-containing protein [Myxococcota bacterium]|nr:cupin-like domain-containing protein [Myxococcota bacterium]